jgi:hypothetical protein
MRNITGNTDRAAPRSRRDVSGAVGFVVITTVLIATLVAVCGSRRDVSGAVKYAGIAAVLIDALRGIRGADGAIRIVVWVSTMIREVGVVVCVCALVAGARHTCVNEQGGQRRSKNTDGDNNVLFEARGDLEEQNASSIAGAYFGHHICS